MYRFVGLSNSSFHAGYFSTEFWRRMSQLVQTGFCSSSKQPNLQPPKKYCYGGQVCCIKCSLILQYDDGCPTERHREAAICVKWRLQKFNIAILKTVTCQLFSNIEEDGRIYLSPLCQEKQSIHKVKYGFSPW